jgi:tetratricopeptide (TPR) repeat protein
MENTAIELSQNGKKAFEQGDFETAVQAFSQSAAAYRQAERFLDAAEAQNNLSVALLQAKRPKEALEAAQGTDLIFAEAKDLLRQAMALGNQAAAQDELGNAEEALKLYRKSAALFGEIGEGNYQETVLKSIAAIELKTGKIQNTAYTMLESLSATKKPNLLQRFLKFILRFVR